MLDVRDPVFSIRTATPVLRPIHLAVREHCRDSWFTGPSEVPGVSQLFVMISARLCASPSLHRVKGILPELVAQPAASVPRRTEQRVSFK